MKRYKLFFLFAFFIFYPLVSVGADYYVRTDGNDANTGRTNTPSGAWKTVGKCFRTIGAGDTCHIQPGVYHEKGIEQAKSGRLVRDNVRSDCSCTKGSDEIRCGGDVGSIEPGQYVRCDGKPGFAWTKVKAVSGSTITLSEGYIGETVSNTTLDVAEFVHFKGEGSSRKDVLITTWYDRPSSVHFTPVSGHPCVYTYDTSSVSDPVWKNPTGFREAVPWSEWDLRIDAQNGRDFYVKLEATGCPCNTGNIPGHVERVFGAYGIDGTKVYLQTRKCEDPNAIPLQAGNINDYQHVIYSTRPYTIIENMTVASGGYDDHSGHVVSRAYGFGLGADESMYRNLLEETGYFHFLLRAGGKNILYTHLRLLSGSAVTGLADDAPCLSGVKLYDIEIRGKQTNQFSSDRLCGVSENDRLIFDRIFLHRGFNHYRNSACKEANTWDCTNKKWFDAEFYRAAHGIYVGHKTVNRSLDHILFQNSIIEITYDGVAFFNGKGGKDVIFRNNTFGFSGHVRGAEYAAIGNDVGGAYGAKLYNNLFLCDRTYCTGSIWYYGDPSGVISDYNAFITYKYDGNTAHPGRSPDVWRSEDNLEKIISERGQEKHSFAVCKTGCSGANGTYYNDGGDSGLVRPEPSGDTPPDYTPTASYRGIDRALQSECPPYDFYGNPRDPGHCDIGAIEYGSGGRCGDGIKNGAEQCDGSDLGGESCTSQGFDGGALSCRSDCTFDTSGCTQSKPACSDGIDNDGDGATDYPADMGCVNASDDSETGTTACGNGIDDDGDGKIDQTDSNCTGPTDNSENWCGDGIKEGTAEECDGSDLGGATCQSSGFYSGTLSCSASCTLDTSGCTNCGNGRVDSGEECDGSDLDGKSCSSLGWGDGDLSCGSDCRFDGSSCSDCKPKTCSDIGAGCGHPSDGCGGTLNCGECGDNEYCSSDYLCVCKGKTCEELGEGTCGIVDNGCGVKIDCGPCGGPRPTPTAEPPRPIKNISPAPAVSSGCTADTSSLSLMLEMLLAALIYFVFKRALIKRKI